MSQQPFLLPNGDSLEAEIQRAMAKLRQISTELESRLAVVQHVSIPTELIAPRSAIDVVSEPELRIQCLGSFEMYRAGERIELGQIGQRLSIVKVLAHFGGDGTRRKKLLKTLWPDVTPEVGANRLRVQLHRLRQDLGDGAGSPRVVGSEYRLAGTDIRVDVDEFERLASDGARYEREGRAEESVAAFEQAAQLYRGDYFEEERFADWPVLRRQQLRDLYLNLVLTLANAAFSRLDHQDCITRCHEILRQDNANEDAYRLLMLAHLRRGNRSRALRWFELCEETLRREFGVAPSDATLAIRQEILHEDAGGTRDLSEHLRPS